MIERGICITNLVQQATPQASELAKKEYREGGERLRRTVAEHRPRVVGIAGIGAYRLASGLPSAHRGRQDTQFEGDELRVAPNANSLNGHETTATLAQAYREPAAAAGIALRPN